MLRSAVKYSGSSSYNSNGLAMYFPYDYPDYYAEIKTETDFSYDVVLFSFTLKSLLTDSP